MFKGTVTEVLSDSERESLGLKFEGNRSRVDYAVRFTNKASGDVLYVAIQDGFFDIDYEDAKSYLRHAKMGLFNDKLKPLDISEAPFYEVFPVRGFSEKDVISQVEENCSLMARDGMKEGQIYEKALRAVGQKRVDDIKQKHKKKDEKLKRQQKTSVSARFFDLFNKKSRG